MHILTLYEKRVKPEDLPFFLGLKEHLAAKEIECPKPIAMRSGETLGQLAGRPSAIISYLDGNSIRRPSAKHCGQVGRELAKMHIAASDFTLIRENALGPKDWRPLYEMSEEGAESVLMGLSDLIEEELGFLEKNWPESLPAGIIHADLFPDNVFFLKDKFSGMIDFYFACNDLLAFDVATCLNAWCFEPDTSFNVTKASALLRAYSGEREFTAGELEYLPVLCRGSALRFLLTRLYDWLNVPPGALVVPKNPIEYVEKLRFHQCVNNAAGYGIGLQ